MFQYKRNYEIFALIEKYTKQNVNHNAVLYFFFDSVSVWYKARTRKTSDKKKIQNLTSRVQRKTLARLPKQILERG